VGFIIVFGRAVGLKLLPVPLDVGLLIYLDPESSSSDPELKTNIAFPLFFGF
jgi:hypothetical protein